MTAETAPRAPGRPRSERADEAIVDAAIGLLVEEGFDRLSMDAVAARAGVGKATIYRRWPSKEALVIEAVARRTDPFADTEVPGGTTRERLTAVLEAMVATAGTELGRLLPCMVGATVSNPPLAQHYREQVLTPRRARIAAILRAGVAAGEVRDGVDVDLAIDLVVGPLLYRIVFSGDEPVAPAHAAALVDAVLGGLAP